MLRHAARRLLWSHEVIWFADGEYSQERFPSDLTYFRQHRLDIPSRFLLSNEVFHTLQLDLSESIEHLFSRLSETTRRHTRKSLKEGITLREDHDEFSVGEFLVRQRGFNVRKSLGTPMTRKHLDSYHGNYVLYSAHLGQTWMGHLLMIHDKQRTRIWQLASNLDFKDKSLLGYASKALVWNSICQAKVSGFSIYDFGGVVLDTNHPAYGVTQFKSSFGGMLVQEQNSVVIPNRYHRLLYEALKGRG